MENELFELAVQASTRIPPKNVIGTKSEYRVHGALKYYFQPDDTLHEVKVNGFICDAVSEDGCEITEIQTRAFSHLKKKLTSLTKDHLVTVIYPVITEKRVLVTYAESGETSIRKSPKKGKASDIFYEIYSLRDLLLCKNLRFRIALITADEYRVYGGTKETRKPFQKPLSTERIPTELIKVIDLFSPADYSVFLPESLPECFGSEIFAKAVGIPRREAGYMLNPLTWLGVIRQIGKAGNARIYEIADQSGVPSHP